MGDTSAAAIKALREKTGAGMMECKRALIEAEGAEDRAIEILRERGLDSAKKVGELVTEKIAKTGEKVTIRRFARYKMGEGLEKRADDFGDEVAKLAGA